MDRFKITLLSINLSAINYAKLINVPNNVFKDLSIKAVSEEECRPKGFEALTYLNDSLIISRKENYCLYSNATGGGWDELKHIAVYKSFSESIERWAYFSTVESTSRKTFGFDIDSSTSGMACFPDLLTYKVRRNAFLEAVERWSLYYWWLEKLPIKSLDLKNYSSFKGFEIQSPWGQTHTVVVYSKDDFSNLTSYGFGCGLTTSDAILKARVEHIRNKQILNAYINDSTKAPITSLYEKRLVHFSKNGADDFINKTRGKVSTKTIKTPKIICDHEIKGAWSKYAKVWRVLFDYENYDPNIRSLDHFMF